MNKLVTPFKVGIFVLAAGMSFLVFLTFVQRGGVGEKDAIKVFALFRDASGLGPKSRVQVAGIQVGEVADIRLEGGRARITLAVRRDAGLKKDALIAKRAESMLGDYLLDLVPGTEAAGPMPDGGEIVHVIDRTGVEEAFERLGRISADIQEVTGALRDALGGDKGALQKILQNLTQLSGAMDETIRTAGTKLNTVLTNLEGFSGDVRAITAGSEDDFHRIVVNVRGATEDVRDVLKTVKQVLGSGEGELKESVASLRETLGRVDESLKHIESVTAKVDRGEGTLGKLVNDPALHESLKSVAADTADYLSRVTHLVTEVTLKSELLLNQRGARSTVQVRLIPKPDKYYFIEVVDDPRGVTVEETVQRTPPGSEEVVVQRQVVTKQALRYSLQYAKRYSFLTLRFGLVESSGGVGANLHFFDGALSVTFDLFDFAALNKDYPRLRASLGYAFLGHLFVTAGLDDALNPPVRGTDLAGPEGRRTYTGRDAFFGAGIFFTDDDLKALFSSIPFPRP